LDFSEGVRKSYFTHACIEKIANVVPGDENAKEEIYQDEH